MTVVAIIGATSGLGKSLSKYLIDKSYSVILVSRSYSNEENIDDNSGIYRNLKDFLTLDFEIPDYCINTACCYGRDKESYLEIIDANIVNGLNIYKYCLDNSVGFINIGTVLERNMSPYALTKNILQEILEHTDKNDLVFNLNLDLFFGPSLKKSNFIAQLITNLAGSKVMELTEGTQRRDFLHVDDVCSSIEYLLQNGKSLKKYGTNFILSTDRSVMVREFILELRNQYEDLFGITNAKLEFGKKPLRSKEEEFQRACDLERFGWHRMYNYKTAITDTLKNWW